MSLPTRRLEHSAARRASLPPLPVIPRYRPLPFVQDKFLSIKSRTAEQYLTARHDITKRMTALESQLTAPGTTGAPLLSPQQADELDYINTKIKRLKENQGFVLPNAAVYQAWRHNVRCGAYTTALHTWLHSYILQEHRGPPYPAQLLCDLTYILTSYAQAALPASDASLLVLSSIPHDADADEVLRRRMYAADTSLGSDAARETSADEDGAPKVSLLDRLFTIDGGLVNPGVYQRQVLEQTVVPIWRAAEKMGFFFFDIRPHPARDRPAVVVEADEEDDSNIGGARTECDWLWLIPPREVQHEAVCGLLTSVRAHHSLLQDAQTSPSEQTNSPLARLHVVLSFYRALAQVAAEAKEPHLLLALHLVLCSGFMCRPPPSSAPRGVASEAVVELAVDAWCDGCGLHHSPALREEVAQALTQFIGEMTAAIYYGLLCYQQERLLWRLHDTLHFVSAAARLLRESDGDAAVGSAPQDMIGAKVHAALRSQLVESGLLFYCRDASDGGEGPRDVDDWTAQVGKSIRALFASCAAASSPPTHVATLAEAAVYVGMALRQPAMLRTFTENYLSPGEASLLAESLERRDALEAALLAAVPQEVTPLEAQLADMWEPWERRLVAALTPKSSAAPTASGAADDSRVSLASARQVVDAMVECLLMTIATAEVNLLRRYVRTTAAEEAGDDEPAEPPTGDMHYDCNAQDMDVLLGSTSAMSHQHLCIRGIEAAQQLLHVTQRVAAASASPRAPLTWTQLFSPPALASLAVLVSGLTSAEASDAAVVVLITIGEACVGQPVPFGSCLSTVALVLARARQWPMVLQLLRQLDASNDTRASSASDNGDRTGGGNRGLSGATMDPRTMAEIFRRARDDGAASVCSYLRPRRAQLFS